MRWTAALLPLAASALLAAGCGGDDVSGGSNDFGSDGVLVADTERGAPKPGTPVKVVGSEYGRVIADRRGEALYLFGKESRGRSECYGACASAWPPALAKGRPEAVDGARQGLLGTTRRRNGKLQLTYAGHPLYYYVADSPGTILCHDVEEFGGLWLVVKPNGRAAS